MVCRLQHESSAQGWGKKRRSGGAVGAELGKHREIRVQAGCVIDGLWPCMRALQRRETGHARGSTRGFQTSGARRRPCRGHRVAFRPRRHGTRLPTRLSTGNLAFRRAALPRRSGAAEAAISLVAPCATAAAKGAARHSGRQPCVSARRVAPALGRIGGTWPIRKLPMQALHAPYSTATPGAAQRRFWRRFACAFCLSESRKGSFSSLMATRKETLAHARAVSERRDGPSEAPYADAARPFLYGAAFSRCLIKLARAARRRGGLRLRQEGTAYRRGVLFRLGAGTCRLGHFLGGRRTPRPCRSATRSPRSALPFGRRD